MKKYDVHCPHCCGTFHETTEHFRQDQPAKGHMFALKQHCVDAGWSAFPPYDTTEYANIVCPSCDQGYLDTLGKVIRLVESGRIDTDKQQRIDWPGKVYTDVVASLDVAIHASMPAAETVTPVLIDAAALGLTAKEVAIATAAVHVVGEVVGAVKAARRKRGPNKVKG